MFKRIIIVALAAAFIFSVHAESKDKIEIKTRMDSIAYSIGVNIGKNLKRDSLMLDIKILSAGFQDALYGQSTMLNDDQVKQAMVDLQQELMERQQKAQKVQGEKNVGEGKKFLEDNKKQPGVQVTPSGLQYKILKTGTGKTPTSKDKVRVHYTGKLINGKVFDSSVERGEPIEFAVTGVIKGWTEALQLMKEGDKWMLYIPSELGYGNQGAGNDIGPNATLIFEVELLNVLPPEEIKAK
jgi:FKBP-type peptidyl-prolyl cis-trans isomerase FklB